VTKARGAGGFVDQQRLLNALGACRQEIIEQRRAMAPKSGLLYLADGLTHLIDDLAMLLTGDKTHFHNQGSTGGAPRPSRRSAG
jgi:hypothetical protein